MVFITRRHDLNTADRTGGGIFALRRPRPYSRRLRGFRCDASPPTIICDHVGINGNDEWEGNDAARRVATSSENRENRV